MLQEFFRSVQMKTFAESDNNYLYGAEHYPRGHQMLGHSIPNSQELSTCSYSEPDQSLGSFVQRIRPGPKLFRSFRNKFIFLR
jgi:hypothetical protein